MRIPVLVACVVWGAVAAAVPCTVLGHGLESDTTQLPWVYYDRHLFHGDVTFLAGGRVESADRLATRVAKMASRGYRVSVAVTFSGEDVSARELRRCKQVLQLHLNRRLGELRSRAIVTWKATD